MTMKLLNLMNTMDRKRAPPPDNSLIFIHCLQYLSFYWEVSILKITILKKKKGSAYGLEGLENATQSRSFLSDFINISRVKRNLKERNLLKLALMKLILTFQFWSTLGHGNATLEK